MAVAADLERRAHDRVATGTGTPEVPTGRFFLIAMYALVVCALALGISTHVLWFDELQAWNIARASHSLADLYGNLRYEGHPILWYIPLFLLARVTANPHAMQVLQLGLAAASAWILLFRAPFAIAMRIALLFGAALFFEFGVMSRSYGLELLVLLLALVVLDRPNPAWRAGAILLVALAWTTLAGAALGVGWSAALWLDRRRSVTANPAKASVAPRWFFPVVLLGSGLAALTCVPPGDFVSFDPGLANGAGTSAGPLGRVISAFDGLWRAAVPLPRQLGAWNTNILDEVWLSTSVQAVLSVALFVLVLRALPRSGIARSLWCTGNLALLGFYIFVILPVQTRFAGQTLLLVVMAAWIAENTRRRAAAPAPRTSHSVSTLGTCLAVTGVVAALAVVPFMAASPSVRLVDAVRRLRVEGPLVSGADYNAVTASALTDRAFYSVARRQWMRAFVFDALEARRSEQLRGNTVVCAGLRIAQRRQQSVAILVDRKVDAPIPIVRVGRLTVGRVDPDLAMPGCNTA